MAAILFTPTAGARCTIFPELCMVIELLETTKKAANHFSILPIVFPIRCMEKFGLNDRRAVSQQNSVTCEANPAKFEALMQDSCAYKNSVKILEIGRRVRSCKATLYQRAEIFNIFGPHPHPLRRLR